MFIGSGFILPGVSGGALAAIFGLYERMIAFLANVTKDFKKNVLFFLPVGIGALAGIVVLSFGVSYLLGNFETIILWFFIGCIVGTILTFVGKKIVPFEKIRTQQKAMKRIEQLFADETGTTDGDGYELVIIHANAPEAGEAWRQKMQEQYPKLRTSLSYFGPVVGTHLGEGALGFSWDIVQEKNLEK